MKKHGYDAQSYKEDPGHPAPGSGAAPGLLPAGAYAGVDLSEVYDFLDRQS